MDAHAGPAKRPKKPLTPYFLFLKDYRDTHGQVAATAVEANKILGDKWNALSEEDKNKYIQRAKSEKEKYEEELKDFKQRCNNSSKMKHYLSWFVEFVKWMKMFKAIRKEDQILDFRLEQLTESSEKTLK